MVQTFRTLNKAYTSCRSILTQIYILIQSILLKTNLLFFILKFNGVTSFLFPLEEIRERAGTEDLVGTRLIARALVKVKLGSKYKIGV